VSSSASDPRALAGAVLVEPGDAAALRALGNALAASWEAKAAARALMLAVRAASVAGQLPLAVAAAQELAAIDRDRATEAIAKLAAAYGKGSPRVDGSHRARPPRFAEETPKPADPTAALDGAERALAAIADGPLPRVPLFHSLAPDLFARLCAIVSPREYAAGAVVVEVGQKGEALYVVARGTIRIGRPSPPSEGGEVILSHLRAGSFFGEMALLTESPRAARATCETPTLLLEIPRRELDLLAESSPEFSSVLADYTRDRLLHNLMITSGVFAPLDEEARARLIARFRPVALAVGETLLDEGAPGGHLYVIVSGAVDIEKRDQGDTLTVTRLGAGDVVGEISLLTRRPATATVRAHRKTHALALARDDFNEIVADFPGVLTHLYQLAVQRERDLERFLAEAVVEADDYLI